MDGRVRVPVVMSKPSPSPIQIFRKYLCTFQLFLDAILQIISLYGTIICIHIRSPREIVVFPLIAVAVPEPIFFSLRHSS
jgi:hypothetical protein